MSRIKPPEHRGSVAGSAARIAGLVLAMSMVVACGGGADAPSPAPAPTPSVRVDKTLIVDGRQRSYTLVLPAGLDPQGTARAPMVIAMHGGGGNAAQFENSSQLTSKAGDAGYAVMYPNGTSGGSGLNTWNGGGCCAYAVANQVDDVNFIRQAIIDATTQHKIDPARVYATGHSNGGIMAYRLACELSDRIAAIAPNAAAHMMNSCVPARPVPVLHMHSRLDTNVPIAGGVGTGVSGVAFPSLDSAMSRWVTLNGCASPPTVDVQAGRYTRSIWSGCQAGATVELYVSDDGGHAWPGGLAGTAVGDTPSTAINANDLALSFFQRHRLPN